ncbi:hypothetical protein QQS21_008093 [Conoideocrella luteorostrata]|uniref:Cytochrome P450 n=1 Tax=Conoideocrella luteorostrata TaxID=1105319 RepID=A0AAJ0CJN2_9HYPO|nr:hypothetical protein QQS21_008093 [Conoideocrella luteorostrata]
MGLFQLSTELGALGIVLPIVTVIVITYALAALRTYWLAMHLSPLKDVQGPANQHWFFGFLNSNEAQSFQMSPKLLEYCARFEGVWASLFTNRRPTLVLGDLDGIHHVLNNAQTYARAQAQMRTTRLVFGDGLVAVDGHQHRRQRRAVGPGFSSNAVEGMVPVFIDTAEQLAERWAENLRNQSVESKLSPGGDGKRVVERNVYSDFEKLSMDIIGEAGFQYKFKSLEGHRSELEAAFVDVTQHAATGSLYAALRSHFPFVQSIGNWLSKEQIQLNRLRHNIETISMRLVKNAKDQVQGQKGSRRKDILGLLVQSNLSEDPKHRLDDEEIVSMIPTLLSGGYDNNASAMSYAVMALAQTPLKQERLRQELLTPPKGSESWKTDSKALESLPYLDAVCRETLRLHSPAHSIPRTCIQDDVIPLSRPIKLRDGSLTTEIRIGRGDDVVIPQKWMNVDPRLWGMDANTFNPERWIQDPQHEYYAGGLDATISGQKHSGWSSLMTFSIGPRNCIGYRMAVAELKACMAILVSRFEFVEHHQMNHVRGEVQIVDRPRVDGVKEFCMPCWVKAVE